MRLTGKVGSSRVCLVLVLLAARRGGEADRGHGHVRALQRRDHLPRGLADAELGAEVPCDVDTDRGIRSLRRILAVLFCGGVHGVGQLHLPVYAVPLDEAHRVRAVEVRENLPEVGASRVDLVEVACDAVLPAYGGGLVEPGDEPVGASLGEDGLSRRALILAFAVEPVHARVELYAVRQHAVGVGPVLRLSVPIG